MRGGGSGAARRGGERVRVWRKGAAADGAEGRPHRIFFEAARLARAEEAHRLHASRRMSADRGGLTRDAQMTHILRRGRPGVV